MASHRKEVRVDDERGRGFPAVVKYGPYLFVSGCEGHRDLASETINPELAEKAVEQCANAYGRVAKRLERAGYSGDCALWIENFTSGQHWRLERMAQWPIYFGEVGHAQAVSFGAQTKMSGLNMLTATVLAVTPDVERVVAVKQPARGRASRITRVGDLVFVIGVRGHAHPLTGEHAPEEVDGAFETQLGYCFEALKSHLSKAGTPIENIVRVDACLRAQRDGERFRRQAMKFFGGTIPFAHYAVGTILGSRCEQEVGAVAAAPGVKTDIAWSADAPSIAQATRAGGLIFAAAQSGLRGPDGAIDRALYGDLPGQLRQAMRNVEAAIGRFGASKADLLRLDVFVRDIYAEDQIIKAIVEYTRPSPPTLTVIGVEPSDGAEIEIVAIAGSR